MESVSYEMSKESKVTIYWRVYTVNSVAMISVATERCSDLLLWCIIISDFTQSKQTTIWFISSNMTEKLDIGPFPLRCSSMRDSINKKENHLNIRCDTVIPHHFMYPIPWSLCCWIGIMESESLESIRLSQSIWVNPFESIQSISTMTTIPLSLSLSLFVFVAHSLWSTTFEPFKRWTIWLQSSPKWWWKTRSWRRHKRT